MSYIVVVLVIGVGIFLVMAACDSELMKHSDKSLPGRRGYRP